MSFYTLAITSFIWYCWTLVIFWYEPYIHHVKKQVQCNLKSLGYNGLTHRKSKKSVWRTFRIGCTINTQFHQYSCGLIKELASRYWTFCFLTSISLFALNFTFDVKGTIYLELRRSAANLGVGVKSFNYLYIGLVLHTVWLKGIEVVA